MRNQLDSLKIFCVLALVGERIIDENSLNMVVNQSSLSLVPLVKIPNLRCLEDCYFWSNDTVIVWNLIPKTCTQGSFHQASSSGVLEVETMLIDSLHIRVVGEKLPER